MNPTIESQNQEPIILVPLPLSLFEYNCQYLSDYRQFPNIGTVCLTHSRLLAELGKVKQAWDQKQAAATAPEESQPPAPTTP